jgi:hypothetical protein
MFSAMPRDDAVSGSPPTSLNSSPSRILGTAPPEQATPTRRISLDAPHDAVEGCSCLLPPPSRFMRKETAGSWCGCRPRGNWCQKPQVRLLPITKLVAHVGNAIVDVQDFLEQDIRHVADVTLDAGYLGKSDKVAFGPRGFNKPSVIPYGSRSSLSNRPSIAVD